MKILIAKANEQIISEMSPSLKFQEETKNTSTFITTPFRFNLLKQTAIERGYNATALFTVLAKTFNS